MNKAGKSGLALMIGAVLGAIVAFLFGTDDKGETKKPVKDSVKKTKEAIRKVDKKKVLKTVEKKLDDAGKYVADARKMVEAKVASLQKTLKTVDKSKYQKAVGEVVTELKKTGKTTGKQLAEIKELLMADYTAVTKKDTNKKGK